MLFGIFDPEIMNQCSETIHNFLELRKENPEIATVVMWGVGLLLWGLVAYYRRSGQSVTWSDIGKGLEDALKNATHKWEWMYPNNPENYNIQCRNNDQLLTHYYDGGFCVNGRSVMPYLSRREKKELKKLKNEIIKILETADAEKQARIEQAQKNEVLNSIKKVVHPTRVDDTKQTDDLRKIHYTTEYQERIPPLPQMGRPRAEVKEIVEEEEEDTITEIYTQEDFEKIFRTHGFEARAGYIDLLAEIMCPEKWRWGVDAAGKPTRNSIRTDKYIWNFQNGICKMGEKTIDFTEFHEPFFRNCLFNLINHIEYVTLKKIYQTKFGR